MGKKLLIDFTTFYEFASYMKLFQQFRIGNVKIQIEESEMKNFEKMIQGLIKSNHHRIEYLNLVLQIGTSNSDSGFSKLENVVEILKICKMIEKCDRISINFSGLATMNFTLNNSSCEVLSHLDEKIELPSLRINLDDSELYHKICLRTRSVNIVSKKRSIIPSNFPDLKGKISTMNLENIIEKYYSNLNIIPSISYLKSLEYTKCSIEFMEDIEFYFPNLTNLRIVNCEIRINNVKMERNCDKLFDIFKMPLLTNLSIEGMQLDSTPNIDFKLLKELILNNNCITDDSINMISIQKHNLQQLSLNGNQIVKLSTYNLLSELVGNVSMIGNALKAIYVNGKIQDFNVEYEVEKCKYFYSIFNQVGSDRNALHFIRKSILNDSDKNIGKLLLSKANLNGIDSNVVFWNVLYTKPTNVKEKRKITTLNNFIQIGIKLNEKSKDLLSVHDDWIFFGLYMSEYICKCKILETNLFKPNLEYICNNWSILSKQYEKVIKIRSSNTSSITK